MIGWSKYDFNIFNIYYHKIFPELNLPYVNKLKDKIRICVLYPDYVSIIITVKNFELK